MYYVIISHMKHISHKTLTWLVVLIVIVGAVALYFGSGALKTDSPASQTSQAPSGLTPIDLSDPSHKWNRLPESVNYQVSSANTYPKYLEASVNPAKVAPGDTQKMRVVVADDVPIRSVTATIETDNDVVEIPLDLKNSATVSREEIEKARLYIVDDQNHLVVNSDYLLDLAYIRARDGVLSFLGATKATAQEMVKYTYEGEWVVYDTSVQNYYTNFLVEDELGRTEEFVVAWYDPCTRMGFADQCTNSTLEGDCNIGASAVGGVQGGDLSLAGYRVTLNTNSRLVFNTGKSIFINTGSIGVDGGKIIEGNLYYKDSDGNSHAPDDTLYIYPEGSLLVCSTSRVDDCYDANASVYVGQTSWFSAHRGDGSFDYNCNGSGTGSTATGGGKCHTYIEATCPGDPDINKEGKIGFTTSVACGNSGTYVKDDGGCDPPSPNGSFGEVRACVTENRLNNCTAPEKELGENGKCHTYEQATCSFDPAKEGRAGFTSGKNCGESGTYVTSGGNCIDGVVTPSTCQTQTKTQRCR
jgi:hypothetical protein